MSGPPGWGRWLAAAGAFYAACTLAFTWPLPRHWTTHVRAAPAFGVSDVDLHLWTLAWVARALARDPLGVFDANIFHPAPLSLAGSDHLLGTMPIAAPVYWATGNPVATLNAVVLLSFPLAGLAAGALVRALTGSGWAGLLGGFVFAFAPVRLRSFVPVQTFTVQYLPLALLALLAWLRGGRGAWLVVGLVALLLQLLVAYYVAYAALVALAVTLAVAWFRTRRAPWRWALLAAGLVAVGAAAAVVSLPYLVRREGGAIPTYGGALGTAALPPWMLVGFVRPRALVYLGAVPVALAVLGVVTAVGGGRRRRTAALVFGAIGLAGWLLCLGSHVEIAGVRVPLPYAWLAAVVPGFASMRVALRFFLLVVLGVAGLAALGIAGVRAWLGGAAGAGVAAALVAASVWQYRPPDWPLAVRPVEQGPTMPPAYEWLRVHGEGGALLEAPLGLPGTYRALRVQSRAMYRSTHHWLPLIGGYTAYPPPSHAVLERVARQLPEPAALDTLVSLVDVRWLLLHLGEVWPAERPAWLALPGVEEAARFGDDVVFRVVREPPRDLRAALLQPTPGRTLAGASAAPLRAFARRARLTAVRLPETLVPGPPAAAVIRVENTGPAVFPGLATDDTGLVVLEAAWDPPRVPPVRVHLPRDLGPGEAVTLVVPLAAPGPPGRYRLRIGLVQAPADRFPESTAPPLVATITVAPPPRAGQREGRRARRSRAAATVPATAAAVTHGCSDACV